MADNTRRDTGNNKANDTSVERATSGDAAGGPSRPVPSTGPKPEGSGALTSVAARAGADYANELDTTGEFPKLVVSDELYGGEEAETAQAAEHGKTEPAGLDSPSAQERTSFWLQHLESEVHRLHGKFETVAAELRVREAKISGLRNQVEAKDAFLTDLRRQVDEQGSANSGLRADLEQANARIADLIEGEAAGEINLAQAEADLQEARHAAAAADASRDQLLEKVAKLSDATDRDAKAAAGAQRRYEDEVKRTSGLRAHIAELETHIEGSKKRWLAVSDELTDFRNKLAASERRLAEAQAASLTETQARERLAAEAATLEGRLEKLKAQLAEGEVAHRELTSRLEERERQHDELLAAKNDLVGRAAELEQTLVQRQNDVRSAVEAGAEKERDLRSAQQKIARLEGLLSEAAREIDELASAIDARESTISRLEADLRARHDAAAVLERSVRRLAEIDTGMAGLERMLVSTTDENAASSSEGHEGTAPDGSDGAVNPSRRMVEAIVGDKPPYPARKVETTIAQSDSIEVQIQPHATRPA
jgi:septal ring factor EnvC (AmiA/AmiB activator)